MTSLTTNPIVITAPGAGSAITVPFMLKSLLWVSDDAAGRAIAAHNQLRVHDALGGNIIVSKRAEAAGDGLELVRLNQWVNGLFVTTMAGGILLVYI
ncbi:MAG: hypothetical protein DDT31_01210 [Syntrophomonadaceae bacterium]|nr:hypothetical protein [Bacillota bacterium]